ASLPRAGAGPRAARGRFWVVAPRFGVARDGGARPNRRRSLARLALAADRLGGAGAQKLRPHLAEQRVRRIEVGAVELAVDGEDIADDVAIGLAGGLERVNVGTLQRDKLVVLERERQPGRRRGGRACRPDVPGQPVLHFAHAVPALALAYPCLRRVARSVAAGKQAGDGRSLRRPQRDLHLARGHV